MITQRLLSVVHLRTAGPYHTSTGTCRCRPGTEGSRACGRLNLCVHRVRVLITDGLALPVEDAVWRAGGTPEDGLTPQKRRVT